MDGWSILIFGRVDEVMVMLLLFDVILREKNLVKSYCLSCLILRREERITFCAIMIHFVNDFMFNSENYVMSFANHLACSNGMSLVCCWRVLTSWIMSWWSWLCVLIFFGAISWIILQYFFHSDRWISRLSLIRDLIHEVEFLLLFVWW